MNNNESKSSDDFKLLDFDKKAKQSIPEPEKPPPQQLKQEPVKEPPLKKTGTSPLSSQSVQKKSESQNTIKSIDELKPELKDNLKKALNKIPEEKINKLIKDMETQKDIIFSKDSSGAFGNLNTKEVNILMEKMNEWDLPDELSSINASVILSWLNKTSKDKNS